MSFVAADDFFEAVTTTDTTGVTTVTIVGVVDLAVALALRSVLREACNQKTTRLCVDVSGVSLCDSAGMAQLFIAHEMRAQQDTPFVVVGASPSLRDVPTQTSSQRDLPRRVSRAASRRHAVHDPVLVGCVRLAALNASFRTAGEVSA